MTAYLYRKNGKEKLRRAMSDQESQEDVRYGIKGPHWRTKDGRDLLIATMEDTHIVHAIHMIQTNREEAVLAAAVDHGLTQDLDSVIGLGLHYLSEEAKKRKLDF